MITKSLSRDCVLQPRTARPTPFLVSVTVRSVYTTLQPAEDALARYFVRADVDATMAAVSQSTRPSNTASEASRQAFAPQGQSDESSLTPIDVDTLHTMMHVIVGSIAVSCEDNARVRILNLWSAALFESQAPIMHHNGRSHHLILDLHLEDLNSIFDLLDGRHCPCTSSNVF